MYELTIFVDNEKYIEIYRSRLEVLETIKTQIETSMDGYEIGTIDMSQFPVKRFISFTPMSPFDNTELESVDLKFLISSFNVKFVIRKISAHTEQ